IDGEGHVRLTDFGLAAIAGNVDNIRSGTPTYMAPEQLAGREVTKRSDIYALGLVLYELFTGKRVFEANTLDELIKLHESGPASAITPSSVVRDLDPAIERAIQRCLEREPASRPPSALQVAAALPGGDPLAAALAAGETPSPEMVAASGGEGAISARAAWGLLLGMAAALTAFVAITPFSTDLGLSRLTNGREVLRARAQSLLAKFGYGSDALDSEGWFSRGYGPIRYLADHVPSTEWRRQMRHWPAPVTFTYRQSPRHMVSRSPDGRITDD